MKAKVEGHVNIYKDIDSGVIINQDNSERSRYRIAREQSKQNLRSKDDISDLRNEIDEIKSLLQQLINK